jgi:pyruvyl transferase EpsO
MRNNTPNVLSTSKTSMAARPVTVSQTSISGAPQSAHIATLSGQIDEALRPYLRGDGAYALIGYPDHSNVGDNAIWMGEIECLERLCKASPRYVAFRQNCDWAQLLRALPEGPIFIHGGGNFGDVWPENQVFREEALSRLRGRQIVQLPQSIHFADARVRSRAAAAIELHGNFVILARDEQSFAFAKASFPCQTELVPDMAMALGARSLLGRQRHELLMVLRKDRERTLQTTADKKHLPSRTLIRDWVPRKEPGLRQFMRLATTLDLGLPARTDANPWREHYYRKLAQQRLTRGMRLLSSAHFVISDRLHVHILCTLLRIPHAIIDQSYRKISSYIATWTGEFAPVELCGDLDEAIASWRRRRTA